ncbi:MAG: hypothetical protein CVV49_00620 [Spirochaetae bacterium HGW-Spirochaetae-5]|nr:MAG: hypothetical protein CVV49_00620 [Spirochaetae bacterium HGW-Spirochaetae-5]
MYIDTINPSLQNFNDSMRGLQQMKQNSIAQRMQQAALLRDMGYNAEAEKMIHSAKNYGLSSLFADDPKEWEAKGIFDEYNPQAKELIKNPELTAQQQILKELQALYGDDKQGQKDYNKNVQLLGAEMSNRKIQETGAGMKEMPGILKSTLTGLRDNEKAVKNSASIEKQNEQIKQSNSSLKPLYKTTYTGNEVDQQRDLTNDTMKVIQNGGGLAAYNKYITTGQAIADHYGHDFKALPPEYFGLNKNKGGSGRGKTEKVYLYNKATGKVITGGMATENELSSSDPTTTLFKKFGKAMERSGIKDPSEIEVQYGTGENTGAMNDLEKEKLKETKAMNEAMAKSQALAAWNEADPAGLDLGIGKKTERAKLANSALSADNPYRFDENGELIYSGGSSNVATTKKPWK